MLTGKKAIITGNNYIIHDLKIGEVYNIGVKKSGEDLYKLHKNNHSQWVHIKDFKVIGYFKKYKRS